MITITAGLALGFIGFVVGVFVGIMICASTAAFRLWKERFLMAQESRIRIRQQLKDLRETIAKGRQS